MRHEADQWWERLLFARLANVHRLWVFALSAYSVAIPTNLSRYYLLAKAQPCTDDVHPQGQWHIWLNGPVCHDVTTRTEFYVQALPI